MIIKTSELEGAALDWAVHQASGWDDGMLSAISRQAAAGRDIVSPSTDWSRGGPLIDKYSMMVEHDSVPGEAVECTAYAWKNNGAHACAFGSDALTAICRAVVWVELGGEVDIPDELTQAA